MFELRILGTVDLVGEGAVTPVTSPATRRLLVRLALAGTAGVDSATLGDELDLNPGALRTAVSRLRGLVEGRVTMSGSRYVLADVCLDSDRFEQLVAQSADHDPETKISMLDEALALWRGAALDGVAHEPWAQPTAAHLDELRADAREARTRAKLDVGRFVEAIADGRAAAADHPMRDAPRALLMEALASAGRRTEALRVFQDYRNYLIEEVGTEPGAALVRLDAAIASATDLPSLPRVAGNLPVPATTFIGRHGELAAVVEALRRSRLVTLTGVGGVGKTRLAINAAATTAEEFAGGTWFVDLGAVEDPAVLPMAIASQLAIVMQSGLSVMDSVLAAFSTRQTLVILDNCEHVLDAAAELTARWLQRAPTVHVLATSRESLHVAGEEVVLVQPFDVTSGTDSAAIALLRDRARSVDPSFVLDDDQLGVATEICQRLDGIALAIELAAARLASMGLIDIRDHLDDRFRLLSVGRRGVGRHQTLRHAVQWSYELLSEPERELLRRCAVFAGGFDLGGAAAVADDALDEFGVIDGLDSLVQKSLLVADRTRGRARFTMLETVRLFAVEQLQLSSSAKDSYERYCGYFASESDRNFELWMTADQRSAYEWLGREMNNLRSAFRSAVNLGRVRDAESIAVRTVGVGSLSQTMEPVSWCAELVPWAEQERSERLGLVYAGVSHGALIGHDLDQAAVLGRKALEIAVANGGLTIEASVAAFGLQVALAFQGLFDEYLDLNQRFAHDPADALLQFRVSEPFALCTLHRFDEAVALVDGVVVDARAVGVPSTIAWAEFGVGLAYGDRDPERALAALQRSVDVAAASGNTLIEVVALREFARLEATFGSPSVALVAFQRILDGFRAVGSYANLAVSLGYLSMLFVRLGRLPQAAQLLAAATTDPAAMSMMTGLGNFESDEIELVLHDPEFNEYRQIGRTLDIGQAVAYARREIQLAAEELGEVHAS